MEGLLGVSEVCREGESSTGSIGGDMWVGDLGDEVELVQGPWESC